LCDACKGKFLSTYRCKCCCWVSQTLLWPCIERRKQERREETEARRRTWQERFAERSDSRAAAAVDTEEPARKRPGPLCACCSRSIVCVIWRPNCVVFDCKYYYFYWTDFTYNFSLWSISQNFTRILVLRKVER